MQVLVIGYVWPEPKSSAAGIRMIQLLEYFLAGNSSVTFATTATPTPYSERLTHKGIQTAVIELNNSSFDTFIKELQPHLVVFDRFMMEEQFGWRVSLHCPDALKILDTEDLHFLRKHRGEEHRSQDLVDIKASEVAKREIASIFRCDLSLIISETEIKFLIEEFQIPDYLLFYLPFLYDKITPQTISGFPDFEDREHFINIGNFKHAPNVDAVIFLKNKIWPLIWEKLPETKMLIYGAYPSAKIEQLNDPNINFLIKGRVKNAKEVVSRARISLAPLRFGAGLKGKLTEAMICGTPTITTPIGADGINGNLEWNGKISNDPQEFANAAVELYTRKGLWRKARDNGIMILNHRFTKDDFYNRLEQKIETLQNHLNAHRKNNFIGAMLMHHRVKSTWHLSKYIEAKKELEKLKSL